MFTGIFTKILVGVIGALLISNAVTYIKYNWFEKPGMLKEIRELQEAGIKAQAQIYRQQAEIKDLEATNKFREVKVREIRKIDEVVQAGDDNAMHDVFVGLGMLPTGKTGLAIPGKGSGPKRKSGAPARAAPVH